MAVLAGAVAALVLFIRSDRIQWPIVTPLMIVAAPGAAIGAAISNVVSPSYVRLSVDSLGAHEASQKRILGLVCKPFHIGYIRL